jgi:23S rRNA (guanosine2251-2'-O)-methyltransferase
MKKGGMQIYGIHPVAGVLEQYPDIVESMYVSDTRRDAKLDYLISHAKSNRIAVVAVSRKELDEATKDANHQGVVMYIKSFPYKTLDEVLENAKDKNALFVILDEVTDPHNVGAIIRSAAGLGADAVLLPKHRQAGITGTVAKSSAGTFTMIPIVEIGSIQSTLVKLQKNGFWSMALDGEGESLMKFVFDRPVALIVGNEGDGVGVKTKEKADFMISIPMKEGVESLNASVAAGVVIYEWSRQNGGGK